MITATLGFGLQLRKEGREEVGSQGKFTKRSRLVSRSPPITQHEWVGGPGVPGKKQRGEKMSGELRECIRATTPGAHRWQLGRGFKWHYFLNTYFPLTQTPRRVCLAEWKLSMNVYQAITQDRQGTCTLIRSAVILGKDEKGEGAFIKHLWPGPRLPAFTHEVSFSKHNSLLRQRKL